MSADQVSRVYARALFEAASEANAVEAVNDDLKTFIEGLQGSEALQRVMLDPQIDIDAKLRVVAELTGSAHPLVSKTLQLLVQRGRFGILEGLYEAFAALAAEAESLMKVNVTSAVELGAEARDRIAARVEAVTGRRVELTQQVDPDIIGGLVLRVGDVIVDSSLKARIGQLRRRLATAELRGEVE